MEGEFHDAGKSSEMIAALIAGLTMAASFDATLDAPLKPPPDGKAFRAHFSDGMFTLTCPITSARIPVENALVLTLAADGSAVLATHQRDCLALNRQVKLTADQTKVFAPLFDPTAYRGFSEPPCTDGSPNSYEMAAGDQSFAVNFLCSGPRVLGDQVSLLRGFLDRPKPTSASAH